MYPIDAIFRSSKRRYRRKIYQLVGKTAGWTIERWPIEYKHITVFIPTALIFGVTRF